jgi:uroporphyrinogen-III synthase
VRVIVTRPAAQAADWVRALRARAIDAVALPLIGIAPVDDPVALHAAWYALPRQRLVVFVSPNAAEQFFAQRPDGAGWPPDLFAGSPGPGTTQVLVRLGVPAARILAPAADAPQFDSESLWAQLRHRDWQGAHVLIVRGDGGRDWLAQTLGDAGATVAHLSAYRRVPPAFDREAAALLREALDRPALHLWLFSSSEAIDNLASSVRADREADWRGANALATHPRIAERARRVGFGHVTEVPPSMAEVIACIQSFRP